jgi:hypothetical protein
MLVAELDRAERCDEAMCHDTGCYATRARDGSPEPNQCQFCYENPLSMFNAKRRLREAVEALHSVSGESTTSERGAGSAARPHAEGNAHREQVPSSPDTQLNELRQIADQYPETAHVARRLRAIANAIESENASEIAEQARRFRLIQSAYANEYRLRDAIKLEMKDKGAQGILWTNGQYWAAYVKAIERREEIIEEVVNAAER